MSKLALPVAELKTALAGLGKVVSKRCTLAILPLIKDGWIGLTGTDLDSFVTGLLEPPSGGEVQQRWTTNDRDAGEGGGQRQGEQKPPTAASQAQETAPQPAAPPTAGPEKRTSMVNDTATTEPPTLDAQFDLIISDVEAMRTTSQDHPHRDQQRSHETEEPSA